MDTVDDRLNGLLLNWYDGRLGHYIGKHRDSRVNMIHGAPIVTISLGEERSFRLAPWRRPDQDTVVIAHSVRLRMLADPRNVP